MGKIRSYLEEKDVSKAKEMADAVALFVNSFSVSYDTFLSEVPEEDRWLLCVAWIKRLYMQSQNNAWTDGRNQVSVNIGALLYPLIRQEHLPEFFSAFAEYMSYEHMTLQQAFSKLIFRMLRTEIMQDNEADIIAVMPYFDDDYDDAKKYYRYIPMV